MNENSSIVNFDYKPTISNDIKEFVDSISEKFKGAVEKKDVKFPNELGEEHPFDFKQMEELCKRCGLYGAVLDKYNDFIWGSGFYITCEDERAKTIIEDFIEDVDLPTCGRAWTKEALNKGSGFLELGGSMKEGIKGVKVLNANNMYVKRTDTGDILGYNQYVGGFKNFNMDKLVRDKKVIPFDNEQIAHLAFNIIGDCAYGLGLGYPAMRDMDNLLTNENDMHKIYHRKANSPLHAKLGYVDGNTKILPKESDVINYGQKMEIMDNRTNWATDALVELKVVDFGNIGDKFSVVLEHDMQKLLYDFQIPPELMGMANIPEGLARVRMEAFQKRIQSMQSEIEKIIEQKIFRRVLMANGLDVHVEFEWGTPSILEVEGRLKLITDMIKSPTVSMPMREILEDELINQLKLDKDTWEQLKTKDEEARAREEQRAQPLVPGQNKGFPQKPISKAEQPKQSSPKEILDGFIEVLMKQEEKRNEQWIKQQEIDKNNLIKRKETDNELMKSMITQMMQVAQEKEIKIREEQKIDSISGTNSEKKKQNKVRRIFNKKNGVLKNGLLPKFKITRKTESVKNIDRLNNDMHNDMNNDMNNDIKVIENIEKVVKKEKEVKYINKNYEHMKECKHCQENWDNVNDIEEWLGFKYKDYINQILSKVKSYDFNQIKATTEAERVAGYLSDKQIDELRAILENGFKKGLSMKDMAKDIDKKLELKDLYRMNEEGDIKKGASGLPILQKTKENRSIGIVRSEVTRLANQGAVEYYKENGISKIKWVASFGDRTCPECEALNGQIYDIGEQEEMPLHPMCRCTYSPVVDLYGAKVKGPSEEIEWKSEMVESDANKFIKNSVIKEDLYHGSTPENIKNIKKLGFNDANKAGTYLSNSKKYSETYIKDRGVGEIIKVKVNAKKVYDLTSNDKSWPDIIKLKKEGYEALKYEGATLDSGEKVMFYQIFNKKSMVVIK